MLGADNYQTEAEIASLLAEGKVPIGVGRNSKIKYCTLHKISYCCIQMHFCFLLFFLFDCAN